MFKNSYSSSSTRKKKKEKQIYYDKKKSEKGLLSNRHFAALTRRSSIEWNESNYAISNQNLGPRDFQKPFGN